MSQDWIDLRERKPRDHRLVLLYTADNRMWVGYLLNGSAYERQDGMLVPATHWMYLPAPPPE